MATDPNDPNNLMNGAYIAPPNPYQTGPIPQTQGDWDMSMPGYSEDWMGANAGQFGAPTYGENLLSNTGYTSQFGNSADSNFWNGVAGKYQSGTPGTTNRAEEAYQSFKGTQPVNMDPYYDREVQTGTNDINRQLASRGMFGSTVGMNQLGNAIGGIRAQQAKDEAGYQLQRGGLLGTLASGADTSSQAQSRNQLDWTKGLGDIAHNADTSNLARLKAMSDATHAVDADKTDRLSAGTTAANYADQNRQGRIFGTEDRTFREDQANALAAMGLGQEAIDQVMALLNGSIGATNAGATASANNAESNTSAFRHYVEEAIKAGTTAGAG